MPQKFTLQFLIALCVIGTALTAAAKTKTSPDDWNIALSPFFLQGVVLEKTASVDRESKLTSLNFSENFLINSSPGQIINLHAHKKDWKVFAGYQYTETDPSTKIPSENGFLDLKAQITELGASYRFATWNNTDFEVLAGTRYQKTPAASFAPNSQTQLVVNDEWWRNTYVGLRFFSPVAENWTFIGRSDIGAGNDGKNIAWNVAAMIDYRLEDWGSFYFGYKLLAFDNDNVDTGMDRYSYDALEQGPFVGLSIRW